MLTTYFTRERTRATYAAGPAGPYLDNFSHWLEQRGVTTRTIRRCLFGATQFTAWAEAAGIAVQSLDATSLEAFCGYLPQHDQLRYASGNPTPRGMGAHHFLTFLRAQGVTAAPAAAAPSAAFPTLLNEFQHWMAVHRVSPSRPFAITDRLSSICSRRVASDRNSWRPRAYAPLSCSVPNAMAKAKRRMWSLPHACSCAF